MDTTQCIIIGSGPAGYTAAIYAARANLSPILIEGAQLGGQLMTTTIVENFPGYPKGITPFEMMDDLRQQAERFGTRFISATVTNVRIATTPGEMHTIQIEDQTTLSSPTLIIATGASARYLGIPAEETYRGKGVSACATCDGFFFRKKTVAVVGGGDTACEEALYLASLCKKVYLIVRKPFLRASQIMQQRVISTPNIEVLFQHNTLTLTGENKVQGADLIYKKGTEEETIHHIDIDGFFLAIGHEPNTSLFINQLTLNEEGYLCTQPNHQQCLLTTNEIAPGVFAAGDCCDPFYRQAIVAAGAGCKAAIEAEKYLQTLPH